MTPLTPRDAERISAWLDGELDAGEAAEVERLVARDADARMLADDLRALGEAVRVEGVPDVPTGLRAAIAARLRRTAGRGGRRALLVHAAGTAAAALLVGLALWQLVPPTPVPEPAGRPETVRQQSETPAEAVAPEDEVPRPAEESADRVAPSAPAADAKQAPRKLDLQRARPRAQALRRERTGDALESAAAPPDCEAPVRLAVTVRLPRDADARRLALDRLRDAGARIEPVPAGGSLRALVPADSWPSFVAAAREIDPGFALPAEVPEAAACYEAAVATGDGAP